MSRADFSSGDQIIITLTDGSTITYTYTSGKFYDEEGNSLSCSYSSLQSYDNKWEIGNEYSFTMKLTDYGLELSIPVTIGEAIPSFCDIDTGTEAELTTYIADAYVDYDMIFDQYVKFSLTEEAAELVESVAINGYTKTASDGYYTVYTVDRDEDTGLLELSLTLTDGSILTADIVVTEHVHDADERTITQAATCTQDGVITYYCSSCGRTYENSIAAAGHSWTSVVVSAGSYDNTRETYTCSVCGEEKTVTSLYGSDRYETASDIVESTFDSCTYAVIANGSNFPDALAAASLAGALNAPILITSDSRIQDTIDGLESLGVTNVYIVGGTSSVSTGAESAIEAEGIEVERVAGGTRQTTAAAVAEEVLSITGTHDVCLVATGKTYADALAASPYAYWSSSPIYLTNNDGSISDEVLASIEAAGYSRIIIIGGTSSVTEATEDALSEIASVTRLGGSTRYETAAEIAEWSVEQGMSYDGLTVATGTNYPDALTASALCGKNGSVLLLSAASASGSTALEELISENAENISNIYIVGGYNSVSEEIREMIIDALRQTP